MRRVLQKSSVASLLLCALLYAWLGHDIHQHHHHHHDGPQHAQHRSQGEASHTTAVQPAPTCATAQIFVAAMLVSFCDFALGQSVVTTEAPDLDTALSVDSQFWERPSSPRAPPAFFSFS